MKKIIFLLLAVASASSADTKQGINPEGFSIGLGMGRIHTMDNIHSNYTYTNLYLGAISPSGYQEFGSFSLGKSSLTRTSLSGHFSYLHHLKNTRLHRFSIGLMGVYDFTAKANTGTVSTSNITTSDPAYKAVYSRYERPASFGSTTQLSQRSHWSIGPMAGFHWQKNVTLFTQLSLHRLSTKITHQGIVGTDIYYDNTALSSTNPLFVGLGLGVGAILGPKTGWFFQPEAEYLRYFTKNLALPNIADTLGFEVTITQKHRHKLSGCAGRLNVGYRF